MLAIALDLNLLHVLVALDSERSVSRAAIALGKQQPTVSAALKRLRIHFDDPLFIYTANRMEPTPRARALVRSARPILGQINQEIVKAPVFDSMSSDQPITLAMSDVGELVLLPQILHKIRELMPRAALRTVSETPGQLQREFEDGTLDLAMGYFPDLQRRNFYQQTLYSDGFAGLVRADHPFIGKTSTLEQFRRAEHAVVRVESRTEEVIERYLARRRIRRRVVLTTPHFASTPHIVSQSDLFVTVPRPLAMYFAGTTANLRMVELPFKSPVIELKQFWHRRVHHDDRNRWLRSLMCELFQSPRGTAPTHRSSRMMNSARPSNAGHAA